MKLLVTRDPLPRPLCTLGVLTVAALVLNTMERPWVPGPQGTLCGVPSVSCVPVGTYDLVLHNTAEHPKTFALVNKSLGIYHEPMDIPEDCIGRSACLIHAGNWAWDSIGCVMPGLSRALNGKTWMVTDSVQAMMQLMGVVPWTTGHTLTIE
jgi:hypothetical protein